MKKDVTKSSRKRWRVILPRVLDLVTDALDLAVDAGDEELIEFLWGSFCVLVGRRTE